MKANGAGGTPWGRLAALAGVALLLLWALLNYLYYFHSNLVLVHNPVHRLGVFSALFGRWTFSLENSPLPELLQALTVNVLVLVFGFLCLRVLRLRLGWAGTVAASYAIGWGLAGFAFILLTMARLLYTPMAWLLWAGLIAGVLFLAGRLRTAFEAGTEAEPVEELPPLPTSRWTRAFLILTAAGVLIVTLTTFWHALFYPETYWDSLILYLGYARMTLLENGFPFKAEAQVGIGLGANYPHLYPNFGAFSSMMFGEWSDMHQRLAAPLAGLLSCVLVYLTAARLFRSHVVAAACTILFRAVPNGIAYTTYSSDYAFAIFYTLAFVYFGVIYLRSGSRGAFAAFTLMPAIGMNLNYLMGVLWVPWLAVVVAEALRGGMPGLRALGRNRFVLCTFAVCIGISVPWYARNWILTGNPVYSFFPEVFTSSVRVNTDVLRSAEIEWFRVGDGVGKLAELYHDFETGAQRNEGDTGYQRRAGVPDRIRASFPFWVGFDILEAQPDGTVARSGWPARLYRLLSFTTTNQDYRTSEEIAGRSYYVWPHQYKMAPTFPALFFPVFLLLPVAGAGWMAWRRRVPASPQALAILLLWTTAGCFLGYMYFVADFYLYQIIGILGPAALLSGIPFHWLRRWHAEGDPRTGRVTAGLLGASGAVLLASLVTPGLTFGLMGFKFSGTRVVDGQEFNQISLDAFRNPGMPPDLFLRLRYGSDVDTWDYANEHLGGAALLTHENRHYVFDPSIAIVHLDDWDVQTAWEIDDPEARVTYLRHLGLEYYLRIPNEYRHPVNARLGMEELEAEGYLEFLYSPDIAGQDYDVEQHRDETRVFFRIRSPEERDQAFSQGLRNDPSLSMRTSTTSPGVRNLGGSL